MKTAAAFLAIPTVLFAAGLLIPFLPLTQQDAPWMVVYFGSYWGTTVMALTWVVWLMVALHKWASPVYGMHGRAFVVVGLLALSAPATAHYELSGADYAVMVVAAPLVVASELWDHTGGAVFRAAKTGVKKLQSHWRGDPQTPQGATR